MFKKHKFLSVILGLLVILSLLTYFFQRYKVTGNYDPRNSKIVIETNSTDLNHISNLIFEKYLNEFKKDNVLKNMKLKDYEVNKIYNIESNNTGFEFYVNYSVKPFSTTAYWIAGNGIEKGSWVNDKVLHVYVERTGQEYAIKGMGTGE